MLRLFGTGFLLRALFGGRHYRYGRRIYRCQRHLFRNLFRHHRHHRYRW